MSARTDCRHYTSRTLATGDRMDKCRLDVAQPMPFDCPDDCLFFEPRPISDAGWHRPRPDWR